MNKDEAYLTTPQLSSLSVLLRTCAYNGVSEWSLGLEERISLCQLMSMWRGTLDLWPPESEWPTILSNRITVLCQDLL